VEVKVSTRVTLENLSTLTTLRGRARLLAPPSKSVQRLLAQADLLSDVEHGTALPEGFIERGEGAASALPLALGKLQRGGRQQRVDGAEGDPGGNLSAAQQAELGTAADHLLAVQGHQLGVGAAPRLVGALREAGVLEQLEPFGAIGAQPVGALRAQRLEAFGVDLVTIHCCSHCASPSGYPMEPSISSWIKRLSSTAYSIGSSLVNGSKKPFTIIEMASFSDSPRLIR
jgi:hypothetical protein